MTILLRKRAPRSITYVAKAQSMLTNSRHRHGMELSGGWVYAIAEDGTPLVKIGHTRAGTYQRLQALASALQASVTLVGVVAVPYKVGRVEQYVHALLASQRIEGEWFYTEMHQKMLEDIVLRACQRMALDMAVALGLSLDYLAGVTTSPSNKAGRAEVAP